MAAEFLERKMAAMKRAIDAKKDLDEALAELPEEWAREIMADAESRAKIEPPVVPPSHSRTDSPTSYEDKLQSPTKAVMALLRQHPAGLPAGKIVPALLGKIRTNSANEKKLLYSIIVTMKRSEKVIQLENGCYQINQAG